MVRRGVVGVALVAFAGCTLPLVTLNRPALRATTPRTIAAPRSTPALRARALPYFAPFCADEGNLDFGDPAAAIRARLVPALADRYALEVVDDRQQSDLVLEIETTDCGFGLGRVGLHERPVFLYQATLRLNDARTNSLLAQATCDSHPVTGPSREDLEQDPDFRREEVQEAVEYCTDDFRHRVLGLF